MYANVMHWSAGVQHVSQESKKRRNEISLMPTTRKWYVIISELTTVVSDVVGERKLSYMKLNTVVVRGRASVSAHWLQAFCEAVSWNLVGVFNTWGCRSCSHFKRGCWNKAWCRWWWHSCNVQGDIKLVIYWPLLIAHFKSHGSVYLPLHNDLVIFGDKSCRFSKDRGL